MVDGALVLGAVSMAYPHGVQADWVEVLTPSGEDAFLFSNTPTGVPGKLQICLVGSGTVLDVQSDRCGTFPCPANHDVGVGMVEPGRIELGGGDDSFHIASNDYTASACGTVHAVRNVNREELVIIGGRGADIIWGYLPNTLILGDEDTEAVCDSAWSSYNGPDILMGGYDNEIHGCGGDDLILGGADSSLPDEDDDLFGGLGADCIEHQTIAPGFANKSEVTCSPLVSGDAGDLYDGDFPPGSRIGCRTLATSVPDCSFPWPIPSYF